MAVTAIAGVTAVKAVHGSERGTSHVGHCELGCAGARPCHGDHSRSGRSRHRSRRSRRRSRRGRGENGTASAARRKTAATRPRERGCRGAGRNANGAPSAGPASPEGAARRNAPKIAERPNSRAARGVNSLLMEVRGRKPQKFLSVWYYPTRSRDGASSSDDI